jgi:hypothetical protein
MPFCAELDFLPECMSGVAVCVIFHFEDIHFDCHNSSDQKKSMNGFNNPPQTHQSDPTRINVVQNANSSLED